MQWTLRKKILVGFGITLSIMVVVTVWALINLSNLGKASDAILKENYNSILAAENMIESIERQDSAILLIIVGYADDGLRQFRDYESQFLQWLGKAKDNITVEGEREIVDDLDKNYVNYLMNFSKFRSLMDTDAQTAGQFYHEAVLPVFTSVRDGCGRLRELNQSTMFKASSRAERVAETAMWSLIIIGAAAVAIGFGFSLVLSKLIVKPIRQMMQATQMISKGNYDVEVSTNSSDELGHLAKDFNAMVKKVKSFQDMNIEQIVTEKSKGEAIIRSIDDGIIVVDSRFRIIDVNPTASQIFGVEISKVQNKHFLEVVKSEDLFEYVKQSAESGRSPRIADDKNVFTISKDEMQSHYQFSITPVRSESGAMLGVVMLLRDVTKLKELDRLKSEFVMAASHELRTPLTSIGMSLDLLRESVTMKWTNKELQLLSVAHEELLRLKSLVNDLLDLSKIEAGKMAMEFDTVPVFMLFEKTMAIFQVQAGEKSVDLSMNIPEGVPHIRADVNKITWVLSNLISNALRYTDRGGHIRLSAAHFGSQVHISVADDGTGIPYEYQSKVFDKFVQVKDDQEMKGSGLGLAICKEMVRAHGGTIWVDSIPGQGSTFTFTLPVAV